MKERWKNASEKFHTILKGISFEDPHSPIGSVCTCTCVRVCVCIQTQMYFGIWFFSILRKKEPNLIQNICIVAVHLFCWLCLLYRPKAGNFPLMLKYPLFKIGAPINIYIYTHTKSTPNGSAFSRSSGPKRKKRKKYIYYKYYFS